MRVSLFSFDRYYIYELPSIFIFIVDFRSMVLFLLFLILTAYELIPSNFIHILCLELRVVLAFRSIEPWHVERSSAFARWTSVKFARSFFVPCIPFVFSPVSCGILPSAHKASYAYRAIIVIDRDEGAKESGGRAPTRRVCGIPLRSLHRIILSVGRSIGFAKSEQDRRRSREPSHSKDIR